jgi:type II secretory pathway component PulM
MTEFASALQYGALGVLAIVLVLVFSGVWKILNRYTDQLIAQADRMTEAFANSVKAAAETVAVLRALADSLEKHDARTTEAHEKILESVKEIVRTSKKE